MTTKILKWGNSQGIRIPKNIMRNLNLHIGDNIKISIKDNKVILNPIKIEIPEYKIDELITKMPNDYKAKEETTLPVGKEEW